MRAMVAIVVLSALGCGGGSVSEPETGAREERPLPASYEAARARLAALTERRLVVPPTDDVDTLVARAQALATDAAEETVAIVRDFDEVIRDNGEALRARCLLGIAAANRALAVLLRNLSYRMPREVEAQLLVLAREDPEAAELARDEIHGSIAEALESRAGPLDHNECVALRGAIAALAERPDPDIDDDALRERIRQLGGCHDEP